MGSVASRSVALGTDARWSSGDRHGRASFGTIRGVDELLSPRILLDRATALAQRADTLAARAHHPFTRDQIGLIGLAARDAIHWIVESGTVENRLVVIAQTLRAEGQRLDELGELLDTHGVDAVPPGHA